MNNFIFAFCSLVLICCNSDDSSKTIDNNRITLSDSLELDSIATYTNFTNLLIKAYEYDAPEYFHKADSILLIIKSKYPDSDLYFECRKNLQDAKSHIKIKK